MIVRVRCYAHHHSGMWPYAKPGDERVMTKPEFDQLVASDHPGKFLIISVVEADEPEPEKKPRKKAPDDKQT